MKPLILLIALISIELKAKSQTVLQSGIYDQKRKSYSTLSGKLIDKYTSKGYYWFIVLSDGKEYRVSVVNIQKFNQAKTCGLIVLDSCFKLDSRKWKRN